MGKGYFIKIKRVNMKNRKLIKSKVRNNLPNKILIRQLRRKQLSAILNTPNSLNIWTLIFHMYQ